MSENDVVREPKRYPGSADNIHFTSESLNALAVDYSIPPPSRGGSPTPVSRLRSLSGNKPTPRRPDSALLRTDAWDS